jgi:hypothetical protein
MCVRAYIYSLVSEVNTEHQQNDLVLFEGWAREEASQPNPRMLDKVEQQTGDCFASVQFDFLTF